MLIDDSSRNDFHYSELVACESYDSAHDSNVICSGTAMRLLIFLYTAILSQAHNKCAVKVADRQFTYYES